MFFCFQIYDQDLPSDHGPDLILRELPPCTQMLRQASSGHVLVNHVAESVLQRYDSHKNTNLRLPYTDIL